MCVCVCSSVWIWVYTGLFFVVVEGTKLGTLTLMTALNASPTPAECLLNTPILACPPLSPLLALWGHSAKRRLQRKEWGEGLGVAVG